MRPIEITQRLNAALAFHRSGRSAEAIRACEEIVAARRDNFDATYLLAMLQADRGEYSAAIEMFRRCIRLRPQFAEVHFNLALALNLVGEHEAALRHYQRAAKLEPANLDALTNLAGTLVKLGRHADAGARFREIVARKPGHAESHNNLAAALTEIQDFEGVLACAEAAIAIAPNDAQGHFNKGLALAELGNPDAAMASYDLALALAPDHRDAILNRFMLRLLKGDLARGFAEMEARPIWSSARTAPPGPAWRGETDLAGKTLLVVWEQGLGDTIQFCRYQHLLRSRGIEVVLVVQKALKALLSCLAPDVQIVADGDPLPQYDAHCPLMSLPFVFGTTLETVPATVPYLGADPARIERWRGVVRPSPGLRVGLVWQGSPTARQRTKSIPLSLLAPLATVPDVSLFSLQKHDGLDQLSGFGRRLRSFDSLDAGADAFVDTAAIIACLDLVISVDTSVAHLAGALGAPTWVMLPHVPDWRWLLDRSDSPWYPNLELFRQPTPGDWGTVVEDVRRALAERAAGTSGPKQE